MSANSYFSFKQFTVHQADTAMKVTTDACILGAYVPVIEAKNILDIGTGTGLIAMMLAQRSCAKIDAVEIEQSAYFQAISNVENSFFKGKINIFHTSIQDFYPKATKQYDLIVSNPPFFQNHLKSERTARNNSLHTDTLSFEDLLDAALGLLEPTGTFVVLLPAYETAIFEALATNKGLNIHKKLLIHHRQGTKILRIITTFGFEKTQMKTETLFIKDSDEEYSDDFRQLLKEYYLIF
jgi:tRNA1Val (adenine37-N6)-methyltransferase